MWTSEQATQIQVIAQKARPGIKTYAIPHGLQVEKGPDAIVEHLVENVPKLLEQWVFENFHNYSKRSWIEIYVRIMSSTLSRFSTILPTTLSSKSLMSSVDIVAWLLHSPCYRPSTWCHVVMAAPVELPIWYPHACCPDLSSAVLLLTYLHDQCRETCWSTDGLCPKA